ncbi:MAG TPA: hypothetical protein DD490_11185, partial [Acidobacteria bacterium]|nr:hypothetical protein [Acidobacteriota bacterium]
QRGQGAPGQVLSGQLLPKDVAKLFLCICGLAELRPGRGFQAARLKPLPDVLVVDAIAPFKRP